jgi:hypothetical protein
MSIVIVTKDQLNQKRDFTRNQEQHIDKEQMFQKWRLSDVTKPSLVLKVIGMAFMPIVIFWGVLMVGVSFAMSLLLVTLKGLSKVFR